MLTNENYQAAAAVIGCDVAAIKAVTKKEGGGSGFYKSGRILIKFEGHLFHALTGGRYDTVAPTLSYPSWTEKYSQFGEMAYDRFNRAFHLDAEAAMKATSWGMFQILGEHYEECGFKSVGEYVDYLKQGEAEQVEVFAKFIRATGLATFMARFKTALILNSRAFALRYNGKGEARNNYAKDIAKYYLQFVMNEIQSSKLKSV